MQDGADQLVSRSVDGWTAGTPTRDVLDGRDALVAFGMNGEPLPVNHGFPVRLVIPGVYGYNSATKWLTELELTTFGAYDAYWASRGYAQQGPLKTLTRIDTPRGLANLPAGTDGHRWRGLGHPPRHRPRRGQGRRRALDAGPPRRRHQRRHLAPVGRSTGTPRPAATR